MNKSEKIEDLITALIKAKAKFAPLKKSKTATVKMKSGGYYSYNYADLADILAMVTPPLAENGLVIIQPVTVTDGQILIDTTLVHATGQWITTNLPLPNIATGNMNAIQQIGSVITYGRRYSIESLLGIASEEDTDGKGGEGDQGKTEAKRKAKEEADRKAAAERKGKTTTDQGKPPAQKKTEQKNGAPKDPARQKIVDQIGVILKNAKFTDDDRTKARVEISVTKSNIAMEALRAVWQGKLNRLNDDFVDDIPVEPITSADNDSGEREKLTDEQMADLEKTADQGWFKEDVERAKKEADRKALETPDIF